MKFKKIYIEISDICGLYCSFCPIEKNTRGIMSIDLFDKALKDCKNYTKVVALHILGDPLKMKNIKEYLNIAKKYNIQIEITTSGIYLNEFEFLLKSPIRQINISLDAIIEIKSSQLRDKFFKKVFDFCKFRREVTSQTFINLRIQKRERNIDFFKILQNEFNLPNNFNENFKVGNQIIITCKDTFIWQESSSINSKKIQKQNEKNGFCYGLREHFGILANGNLVPCCIDASGNIILGNIKNNSIKDIFAKERTKKIIEGFKKNIIIEEFCKSCDYRKQFI